MSRLRLLRGIGLALMGVGLVAVGAVKRACAQSSASLLEASAPVSTVERATRSLPRPITFEDPDRYSLSVRARFGVATAPFFTRALPVVRGHGVSLRLSAAYRLSSDSLLGVEAPPVVLASVAQPAQSYVDTLSWGNPRFSLSQRAELWNDARIRFLGVASAALGAPIARHGPAGSLFGLRALQLASAFDALRDQDLYTSGILPLAVGYATLLEQGHWSLELNLRVPLLLRLSRAGLPEDAKPRLVGLTPSLHLVARLRTVRWLEVSLAADTVFDVLAPVASERPSAKTQLALAPILSFSLHRTLRLRTDFLLPLGGVLGGRAYSAGLQLVFEP
jgi:hypothetical protein